MVASDCKQPEEISKNSNSTPKNKPLKNLIADNVLRNIRNQAIILKAMKTKTQSDSSAFRNICFGNVIHTQIFV